MARFSRLETLDAIIAGGLVPLFYHPDPETVTQVAAACGRGGARVVEFTNRGDFAWQTYTQAAQQLGRILPQVILGAGSVIDAPTAALYIASGANFIVSPSLNPEVARLCNRRKIAYLPGCSTPTEIGMAEELGVEIVKLFPGETFGPEFVRAMLAPSPWTRILPTGGVEPTGPGLRLWFEAGAAAVGIGSKLLKKTLIQAGEYEILSAGVAAALELIRSIRQAKGG